MKRWYVVNAQPHREARADENLRRQGFETWLPVYRRTRRHARRIDSVLVPMFPGYLFVRLDVESQRWRAINGTFGVIGLLCHGENPQAVPGTLVEGIMQRRDANGVVVLAPRRFVEGQRVRVVDGPLAELEGLFQEMAGHDRVVLLFNLLGRKVRATVPVGGLAA